MSRTPPGRSAAAWRRNRRDFLKAAGMGAFALEPARRHDFPAKGTGPMSEAKVSFSVFSKFWNIPVEKQAEYFSGLGFQGVELPVRDGYEAHPGNVAEALPAAARKFAAFGMKITSVALPNGRPSEAMIAACGEAGVPVMRDMVRVPKGQSYLKAEEQAIREYEALVPLLEKHGTAIGIQNHGDRFVANAAGLRRIVERFDPRHIGAVYDMGHCAVEGEIPESAIDLLWSHLKIVNFKNLIWVRENGPEALVAKWKKYVTSGRQGLASWADAARELKARGYAGVCNICAEFSDMESKDRLLAEDLAYARELFGA